MRPIPQPNYDVRPKTTDQMKAVAQCWNQVAEKKIIDKWKLLHQWYWVHSCIGWSWMSFTHSDITTCEKRYLSKSSPWIFLCMLTCEHLKIDSAGSLNRGINSLRTVFILDLLHMDSGNFHQSIIAKEACSSTTEGRLVAFDRFKGMTRVPKNGKPINPSQTHSSILYIVTILLPVTVATKARIALLRAKLSHTSVGMQYIASLGSSRSASFWFILACRLLSHWSTKRHHLLHWSSGKFEIQSGYSSHPCHGAAPLLPTTSRAPTKSKKLRLRFLHLTFDSPLHLGARPLPSSGAHLIIRCLK